MAVGSLPVHWQSAHHGEPPSPRGGCTALGWFFGFKFHLPISHHGQIMAFKITGGNPDARQPLKPMTAALRGR